MRRSTACWKSSGAGKAASVVGHAAVRIARLALTRLLWTLLLLSLLLGSSSLLLLLPETSSLLLLLPETSSLLLLLLPSLLM